MTTTFAPPPDAFSIHRDYEPVWAEHEAPMGPKGESLPVNREMLERVAANCNALIENFGSGGYVPVVLTHPTPEAPRKTVVGVMGPYKVGKLGNGKWGILAQRHYSADHEADIKDHPGKSVDFVWRGDDPGAGYFRNLALLPAGTSPRLQLGMSYEQPSSGQRCLRYSIDADSEACETKTMDESQIRALVIQILMELGLGGTCATQPAGGAPAAMPYKAPEKGKEAEKTVSYEDLQAKTLAYEAENAELKTGLQSLTERFNALAADRTKEHRYSVLKQLASDGYPVLNSKDKKPLEEEMEFYASYDESGFEKAIAHRRATTQPAPRGSLPIPGSEFKAPALSEAEEAAKAAEINAKAKQLVYQYDQAGKTISYAEAREKIMSGAA